MWARCIFLLYLAATYGEVCNDDQKKFEIIKKIEDYLRHHHDQDLLRHVLEHYIYPDMYMVDLGRHYEQFHDSHHHHHHSHHHSNSYNFFGKRQTSHHHQYSHHEIDHLYKELEHLVKAMVPLNDVCVLDILYFVEGKLGLSHLGKTTVPTTTHTPPTTHAVHHTTTTAATTTTTTQPTTTTPPPLHVQHTCNSLQFVQAVAIGNPVLNQRAGLCTDGTHSQSEALVLNTCSAQSPTTWKSGYNVMQNCARIPRYTPIATFVFGMYSMDGSSMSGVFINCTPNGFKMAVQVCGHGPLIFEVQTGPNHTGREDPNSYYTINW